MNEFKFIVLALALGASAGSTAAAESDAHAGHSTAVPASAATPAHTQALASGKAREAGEGTEMMEPTGVEVSLAVQCAQAARGMIMLDRATLAQCAGQAAPPAAVPAEHHRH